MWLFPLACVCPDCGKHRLTAAGLYSTVRKVLDINGWYDLATEYLECKRCKKKYPAWSEDILGQLDLGPPQSVSSFADIQAIHNGNRSSLGALCYFVTNQKHLRDYTVVSLDTRVTTGC